MNNKILVFNAGSSSLKFSVFSVCQQASLKLLFAGEFSRFGMGWNLKTKPAKYKKEYQEDLSLGKLVDQTFDILEQEFGQDLDLIGIGHRIVHGGRDFSEPVFLSQSIILQLEKNIALAPLHQPSILEVIAAAIKRKPQIRQIGCFDTGFHKTQNPLNRVIAIPKKYTDLGIQNYGFHGLSYQYVSSVLQANNLFSSDAKIVIAHLGSGASLCAIKNFSSVATSMGFSPLGGLIMGTRPGTLDPAVVFFLQDNLGLSVREIEHILYKESGLKAVSEGLSNMRELLEKDNDASRLAVDLFVHKAIREIGSLIAELKGLEGLVFTGGIGENSALIRHRISQGLSWLGLELCQRSNLSALSTENISIISTAESKISAMVVSTDENIVIAEAAARLAQS